MKREEKRVTAKLRLSRLLIGLLLGVAAVIGKTAEWIRKRGRCEAL